MKEFDWGNNSGKFILVTNSEIFERNIYEKYFTVDQGDIVVDIGASTGPFTYSIMDKKPQHCWAIEPMSKNFKCLYNNLQGYPVSFLRMAITDISSDYVDVYWDGALENVYNMSFSSFINYYGIDKIDFLKSDCEGGEYDIFKIENLDYLKNIKKIVTEFHLRTEENKFRYFRDNILINFDNYEIHSVDGINIKNSLFHDGFIEYYSEILIYFKNK